MSKINGITCLASDPYKGFIIDLNKNAYNNSPYYSVTRLPDRFYKKDYHVHIESSRKAAESIVDCYYAMKNGRDLTDYGRLIRNRAMALQFRCKVRF